MSLVGHVQDGVIVFDEPIDLPNGTTVRVEPVATESPRSLADLFGDLTGSVTDLPPDMAEQHDHYLYRTPKK